MARVLIVDDEPNINLVLETVLTDEGHNVTKALDGLSGLEKLKQSPLPEIVFVDLMMPKVSGRQFVETMHGDPQLCNIPVVIMSGSTYNEKDFPPKNYFKDLLTKPFDIFEALHKVEQFT